MKLSQSQTAGLLAGRPGETLGFMANWLKMTPPPHTHPVAPLGCKLLMASKSRSLLKVASIYRTNVEGRRNSLSVVQRWNPVPEIPIKKGGEYFLLEIKNIYILRKVKKEMTTQVCFTTLRLLKCFVTQMLIYIFFPPSYIMCVRMSARVVKCVCVGLCGRVCDPASFYPNC